MAYVAAGGLAFAATATASMTSPSTIQCDALPVHGVAGTNQERTFLAVKPDGVQRALVGDIIARFEKRGYKVSVGSSVDFSNMVINIVLLSAHHGVLFMYA